MLLLQVKKKIFVLLQLYYLEIIINTHDTD